MPVDQPKHIIAIVGGAVSGSEAASQLAGQGVEVVVFEQNNLPYGKIEDGLPKWHVKLRNQEETRIDERLNHPLISFVPGVRLGRDIELAELTDAWGFSAVLLATGAWQDRPLPIDGIDAYLGKGLIYQNAFIHWYNHKHEPAYQGPEYDIPDGTIIIGGGLASLDVAKVVMFELVERALHDRGYTDVDLFTLDRTIAGVLEEKGLSLDKLGIKGCTVYYRRRIKDMPLSPRAADTPDDLARVQKIQEKILLNYQSKYLFDIQPCWMPVDKLVEGDRLCGLVFQRTKVVDNRVIPQPGETKEVYAPLIISSIGSIPEAICGIPMDGQVYRLEGEDCCRVEGYRNVFVLGNAVTGRGNIRESQQHGREVVQAMAERYLHEDHKYEQHFRRTETETGAGLQRIVRNLEVLAAPTARQQAEIRARVRELQLRAGYDGDYPAWVGRHRPVRLEEMGGVDG